MTSEVKTRLGHSRLTTATCAVCGKTFDSTYGRVTCSTECQTIRRREIHKKRYQAMKSAGCAVCGKPVNEVRFCSSDCRSILMAREREALLQKYRDKRKIPAWLEEMDTPEANRLKEAVRRSDML